MRAVQLCTLELENRLKIEYSRVLPTLIPYAFLYEAYRPEVWYWECVECVRRLSLTGLLVFMYPGSEKQVLLAMLICFFWLMIYSEIQPYLESSHSFFLMSSQWGVLLQLYAIYLIINHSFDSSSSLIGGLAVAVGVVVFAYCLTSIGRVFWIKLRVGKESSKNMELV